MTITGQSALSKEDIDRMVRDAEAHAEEDRRRREEAEVRNQADTLAYQTDKLLKEQGDKVGPAEREPVESALKELKDALGGNDVPAIRSASERLVGASQAFTSQLYQQAAAAAGGASQAGGTTAGDGSTGRTGGGDDDVVDAEVV